LGGRGDHHRRIGERGGIRTKERERKSRGEEHELKGFHEKGEERGRGEASFGAHLGIKLAQGEKEGVEENAGKMLGREHVTEEKKCWGEGAS